jgi:hypothetical protein
MRHVIEDNTRAPGLSLCDARAGRNVQAWVAHVEREPLACA